MANGTLQDILQNMKDASAVGSWRNANERLKDATDQKEIDYLNGVKKNAVMSGVMSGLQGANSILNTSLQAAQIADPTMYEYDIWTASQQGSGPYYDYGQLAADQANATYAGQVSDSDIRGMTTGEKWGSVGTGALAGAMTGAEIGGPWGAVIGGAVGGLASLGGVLAGNTKAHREAIRLNNQADIANQYAQQNFASAFESIAERKNRQGQVNIAAEGGKMSRAAKDKHMTIKQFADSVLAKQNAEKYSTVMEKHTYSAGGKTFNTHGGYYSPDYIKIDAGGTHEQNPFGGIQLGVDPQGLPNLVEEGEIIHEDYVFSDRLKATESELKEFALPAKYAGQTYAYIADKLSNENKERPNDAVSNKGLEVMYDRLMAMQDYHKAKQEEARMKRELKKMSPEELEAIGQAMAMQAVPPEEQAMQQPEMMPMEQAPVVAAEGGRLANMYELGTPPFGMQQRSGFVLANDNGQHTNQILEQSGTSSIGDPRYYAILRELIDKWPNMTHEHLAKFAQRQYEETYGTKPGAAGTTNNSRTTATTSQPSNHYGKDIESDILYKKYVDFMRGQVNKDGNLTDLGKMWMAKTMGGNPDDYTVADYNDWLKNATDGKAGPVHDKTFDAAKVYAYRTNVVGDGATDPIAAIETKDILRDTYLQTTPTVDMTPVGMPERPSALPSATTSQGEAAGAPHLPTWHRYAGAAWNGISALTNLLQEPDRYQTRFLTPSPVYGTLALDRLQYNPYDYNIANNQINANAAATNLALQNSGIGPSTGAALLAANYNNARNLGNSYWQTKLANQQQLANVTQANNQAAQAEANFDYQRNLANAQMRNQYGLYNLQNAIQTDMLNKQAETQKWQAVSQAGDAFAQDVANMGRENFNMNMVNSNPALFYFIDPSTGMVDYKKWAAYNEMQNQKQTV